MRTSFISRASNENDQTDIGHTKGARGDEQGYAATPEADAGPGAAGSPVTSAVKPPDVSLIKSRRLLAALVGCIMPAASNLVLALCRLAETHNVD